MNDRLGVSTGTTVREYLPNILQGDISILKCRERTYSGSTDPRVSERELKNRELARRAAAEGMVLLKNDGILPISKEIKIAIYGEGVAHLIKGGTGSGDVNEREVVSVQEALAAREIQLTNQDAALAAPERYDREKIAWKEKLQYMVKDAGAGSDMAFLQVLTAHPFCPSDQNLILEKNVRDADAIIYIISRISGEGCDRKAEPGDYDLSKKETEDIASLSEMNPNLIVLLNIGGQMEVSALEENPAVRAILYISQGGIETGNAAAQLLTGEVTPSGKLASTWAVQYSDYPNAGTFSYNSGDTDHEEYVEGIYAGYRYFDSFGIAPLFPFGYGLSYTDFRILPVFLSVSDHNISVGVKVKNTGSRFSGKEVVQIYAACPPGGFDKECKRLVGFQKTHELRPGEEEMISITCPRDMFASFSEDASVWMIEKGDYMLFIGNSSACNEPSYVLHVEETVAFNKKTSILPLRQDLKELKAPSEYLDQVWRHWREIVRAAGIEPVIFSPSPEQEEKIFTSEQHRMAEDLAGKLSDEELISLVVGEISKGQDNLRDGELVTSGLYVPGAAGETTSRLEEKYGIPAVSMADGPAGLRLMRHYDVDRKTGLIYSEGILAALAGGLFSREEPHENADRYYMFATAIPVGTLLAQTWNPKLLTEIGKMIGGEMIEFGITWWLAPGMNIQRNPLCGRNFEYYSEDPLLSGTMAAAITKGVQSLPGIGTTIKHFACNNQEDNRMFSDSIVSERALREIYLRGFEIAVKTAQPMCVMTSYNRINGVPAANSDDLIRKVLREEWDFQGIVMTDWTPTTSGCAISHRCISAGNDLIMPGNRKDIEDIKQALENGTLTRDDLKECAKRLIRILYMTNAYEDQIPYGERFL